MVCLLLFRSFWHVLRWSCLFFMGDAQDRVDKGGQPLTLRRLVVEGGLWPSDTVKGRRLAKQPFFKSGKAGMTGGSLGRTLTKRKRTLLSDFFLNRFYRSFSKRFATLTRACVFVVSNRDHLVCTTHQAGSATGQIFDSGALASNELGLWRGPEIGADTDFLSFALNRKIHPWLSVRAAKVRKFRWSCRFAWARKTAHESK